jgi:hypothetical protein
MTTSTTIAGLIGPTLVAIAAGMLLNIGSFPALAEQVSRDPALMFVSGILLFIAGLASVRVHNRWTNGWPVLVTSVAGCSSWLALPECFFQPDSPRLPPELASSPARSSQQPSSSWGSAPFFRSRHESTFATVRHRTIRSKGCLSNRIALAMVFKLLEGAQKSWRRLDGHNQLPKLVLGVTFDDGIEVIAKPTDCQPITAAA